MSGLVDWIRTHQGMAGGDLNFDVLRTTESGNEFESAARHAADSRDVRAVPIIVARMGRFAEWNGWLFEYLNRLDSPLAVPAARHALAKLPPVDETRDVMTGFREDRIRSTWG